MPLKRSPTAELLAQVPRPGLLCCQPAGIVPFCVIWYFEYRVLVRYTEPGASVFTTHPSPVPTLEGNCLKEFDNLSFTLVGTMIYFFTDVVLQVLAKTKPCGGILVAIVALVESAISYFITYLSIEGIYTTAFEYKDEAVAKCEDLHNTSWWIYIGLSLISMLGACSLFCCVGVIISGAHAREPQREPLVVTPTPEEVSYQKLPNAA